MRKILLLESKDIMMEVRDCLPIYIIYMFIATDNEREDFVN